MDERDWLGDVAQETPRNRGGRPAKDYSARSNRRLECPSCGFHVRTSAAQIERAGAPTCACGERMVLSELRDRAVIEWEQLRDDLLAEGAKAAAEDPRKHPAAIFNAAMRELGYTDALIHTHPERQSGADRRRCTWPEGYCTRWPLRGSDRCQEHAR